MQAIEVITDAFRRCNRLSPGETLPADDASMAFDELNLLVDEMSAQREFLYRLAAVQNTVTGNITLGTAPWAEIAPGSEIDSVSIDDALLAALTPEHRAAGGETGYFYDGFATIEFFPALSAKAVRVQTRKGVAAFADQTTQYTVPPGYRNALGANLALRIAPLVMSQPMPYLAAQAASAMRRIARVDPVVLDVFAYTGARFVSRSLF